MSDFVHFERKDWTTVQQFTLATENKVWSIIFPSMGVNFDYRRCQIKIKKQLLKEFSSIVFLGNTSIYFYFKDQADEALFIFTYVDNGLQI